MKIQLPVWKEHGEISENRNFSKENVTLAMNINDLFKFWNLFAIKNMQQQFDCLTEDLYKFNS